MARGHAQLGYYADDCSGDVFLIAIHFVSVLQGKTESPSL